MSLVFFLGGVYFLSQVDVYIWLLMHTLFSTRKHEGDGEEHISGRNLKYDAQSQRYIFGEDQTEATSCSICMEPLGKQVEQLHNIALKPLLSTILNRVPIILQHPRMTL